MNVTMFVIIVVAVLIVVGLCALAFKKNKKMLAVILPAAVVLGGVGFVLFNTVFYNNSDSVEVYNPDEKKIPLSVDNHLDVNEHFFVRFSSDKEFDELAKTFEENFDKTFANKNDNIILAVENNWFYTLKSTGKSDFLWTTRNKYILSCDVVTFEYEKDSDKYVDVPFPISFIGKYEELTKTEFKTSLTFDEIAEYYKDFSNAEITDDTITLKCDEYTVDIIVIDGIVKFSAM